MVEITEVEQNKEITDKINENSLRNLWNNVKYINFWIIAVPEEERQYMRKYLRKLYVQATLTWERK